MHSAITDKSCLYNEIQPVQKVPNEAFILKKAGVFGFPDKQIKIEMKNKKMCFFTV